MSFSKHCEIFFRFYGEIDCMETHKTGFQLKSKAPPRCSISELVQLFGSRRRPYGGKVQKKVSSYLHRVSEYYRKVFSGEISLPTKDPPPRGSAAGSDAISPKQARSFWV